MKERRSVVQSDRSPLVTLEDIKGSVERHCFHDNTGRKPALLSRVLVINNAITLPQVTVCVACVHNPISGLHL